MAANRPTEGSYFGRIWAAILDRCYPHRKHDLVPLYRDAYVCRKCGGFYDWY